MRREFARGGLEEIVFVLLDVIVRDPGPGSNRNTKAVVIKIEEGPNESTATTRSGNE
jgi:hypothetical protein